MRSGFASLAVVGVAACIAVYALTYQQPKGTSLYTTLSADEMEFLKYVSKYGKSYGTKEEFEQRSALFKERLETIVSENSKNDNTFRLTINKFADWTPAEYKRILGYKPRMFKNAQPAKALSTNVADLPDTIDWRTKGAVNPVKDQGQCGSCWAFSAIGAVEGRWQIKSGTLVSLSEQQLVDCVLAPKYNDTQGCDGGEMDQAIQYAADNGLELEKDYVYTAKDGTCAYDPELKVVTPKGPQFVTQNSTAALKAAIAEGPVSVALEADKFVFQFYGGGILNSQSCGLELDHAVVAVGYGKDKSGKEYYIVRNSWGDSWGVGGYINIAINGDGPGICGIQQSPVIPLF